LVIFGGKDDNFSVIPAAEDAAPKPPDFSIVPVVLTINDYQMNDYQMNGGTE